MILKCNFSPQERDGLQQNYQYVVCTQTRCDCGLDFVLEICGHCFIYVNTGCIFICMVRCLFSLIRHRAYQYTNRGVRQKTLSRCKMGHYFVYFQLTIMFKQCTCQFSRIPFFIILKVKNLTEQETMFQTSNHPH